MIESSGTRSIQDTPVEPPPGRALGDLGETVPEGSIWPCVAAAGLTAVLFGLVTGSVPFVFVGAAGLIVGAGGWVGELGRGGGEHHGR